MPERPCAWPEGVGRWRARTRTRRAASATSLRRAEKLRQSARALDALPLKFSARLFHCEYQRRRRRCYFATCENGFQGHFIYFFTLKVFLETICAPSKCRIVLTFISTSLNPWSRFPTRFWWSRFPLIGNGHLSADTCSEVNRRPVEVPHPSLT